MQQKMIPACTRNVEILWHVEIDGKSETTDQT